MDVSLCDRCGFDANGIAERLGLVGLTRPGMDRQGRALQDHVIRPNTDAIVDRLYSSLFRIEDFTRVVDEHSSAERIRKKQEHYLQGLGIDFERREYFEERLRIGAVHQSVGVSQGLYQCTFQALQNLLIEYIPQEIRDDKAAFAEMLQFILKITALDMSLAVESYCSARVSDLRKSLETERGETNRLRKIAVTDWLTNLHNHSYSRHYLATALEQAEADGSPVCVVMADLDHFKAINDAYGHLIGDEVLRITARRLTSGARGDDEVCRYGGEEFLFILQNTDLAGGVEVAERVRARINEDVMHSGDTTLNVTISLGVAQARDRDTVEMLIERADAALYVAKRAGRNCVRAESAEHVDTSRA